MVKPRIIETNEGIQNESTVKDYDSFLRQMRDKGWMVTNTLISSGINQGNALEVGPGPGYLGLEWLSKTEKTRLTGIEISQNMIDLATKNALRYGLRDRVSYRLGNADKVPFPDQSFDAVFSNGSLHEWEDPKKIFNEIHRVLKPGGKVLISDLRRNLSLPVKCLFYLGSKPTSMRKGLTSSLRASYLKDEIEKVLKESVLNYARIKTNPFGLTILGTKPQSSF